VRSAATTKKQPFATGFLAMTRQSTDSFARRLLDEVGATEPLRPRFEDPIGPS